MSSIEQLNPELEGIGRYNYGWADSDVSGAQATRGLNEDVVRDISTRKNEPEWMLDLRLKGLKLFGRKPLPTWGSDLSAIDFDNIKYFVRSTEKQATSWEDLPEDIKNTYDKLGIPEAEKQRLVAGVAAQYESEVVYHSIREDLEAQGVIFLDTDTALREHEDIFKEYFGSVIPVGDNKFAALNTSVWSGGSFIYVPKGVKVDIPLQAYFRINTENMGQFERTLIIVDEDAYVHYVEGCTAPIYSSDSLHSAVVEIIVKRGGRCRYTTIQNWSNNVYNLVTKRATCEAGATMEWVDGNIGSKVTMKYPAIYLLGEHSKGETLSIAFAGEGQHQDAGAKMVHAAPYTSSSIISKSVARGGGRTSYRGLVQVADGAHHSASTVRCDALLVDQISRSDTYPYVDVREDDVSMGHEATVSKVSDDQLFYLMSRGMGEDEAMAMIVRGFIEPIARELPMEYALELNRLIELQMEGAVGWGGFAASAGRVVQAPLWSGCERKGTWRLFEHRQRQGCGGDGGEPPPPAAVVRPRRPPRPDGARGGLAVHADPAAPRCPRRRAVRRCAEVGRPGAGGRDDRRDHRTAGEGPRRDAAGRQAVGARGGQLRGGCPRRRRRRHRARRTAGHPAQRDVGHRPGLGPHRRPHRHALQGDRGVRAQRQRGVQRVDVGPGG
jgi:Fe-S cluster assembly protein SufB